MHITASVFIDDDESGLHEDYKKWLEDLGGDVLSVSGNGTIEQGK